MNLAAELAARDMSALIHIYHTIVTITLINRSGEGSAVARSRLHQCPGIFVLIETEIERLLEGCDG